MMPFNSSSKVFRSFVCGEENANVMLIMAIHLSDSVCQRKKPKLPAALQNSTIFEDPFW